MESTLFKLFFLLFAESIISALSLSAPTHVINEKAKKSLHKETFVRSYPHTNS